MIISDFIFSLKRIHNIMTSWNRFDIVMYIILYPLTYFEDQ